MIRLIQGNERGQYAKEIDAMHRNRAFVFSERLGWDVKVENGWEIDLFDHSNPLYLVSLEQDAMTYCGSLRLLPTTGPNMLRDVFSCLLPEGEFVESAAVRESSRFSVSMDVEQLRSANRLNFVTAELLCGILEVGLSVGLSHVVSVFDSRMMRILRTAGTPPELIGTPQRIGKAMTYAGFFEISEESLTRVRATADITGSVLEPNAFRRHFAA